MMEQPRANSRSKGVIGPNRFRLPARVRNAAREGKKKKEERIGSEPLPVLYPRSKGSSYHNAIHPPHRLLTSARLSTSHRQQVQESALLLLRTPSLAESRNAVHQSGELEAVEASRHHSGRLPGLVPSRRIGSHSQPSPPPQLVIAVSRALDDAGRKVSAPWQRLLPHMPRHHPGGFHRQRLLPPLRPVTPRRLRRPVPREMMLPGCTIKALVL